MELKTKDLKDMLRLMDFIHKYIHIFESGNVERVVYGRGAITIYPTNDVIDSLNGTEKPLGDDNWTIYIEK